MRPIVAIQCVNGAVRQSLEFGRAQHEMTRQVQILDMPQSCGVGVLGTPLLRLKLFVEASRCALGVCKCER